METKQLGHQDLLQEKRNKEIQIVKLMIELYCRKRHGPNICPECQELLDYASARVEACPFMETKTFCSKCTVHCYNEEMRGKIKRAMRFSGPRIILYHPVLAVKHLLLDRGGN